MQRLSIQPMQLTKRTALRPRLPQQVLARHAYLSTSAHYRDDISNKTVSTNTIAAAQHPKKPAAVETESGANPELPKFSLDGLGVSKNMKIFLVLVLSIFGTMETWFYCNAIWRWWNGDQDLAVAADDK